MCVGYRLNVELSLFSFLRACFTFTVKRLNASRWLERGSAPLSLPSGNVFDRIAFLVFARRKGKNERNPVKVGTTRCVPLDVGGCFISRLPHLLFTFFSFFELSFGLFVCESFLSLTFLSHYAFSLPPSPPSVYDFLITIEL